MTEYGKRIAPYLLSHSKEENPEMWETIERVIDEVIQNSDKEMKKMSKEKRFGMNEVDEHGIMNYCEFTKCHYGEERYDLGGCGTASSGETCYTLYPPDDGPLSKYDKFIAYEIHLEETRLNNEQREET